MRKERNLSDGVCRPTNIHALTLRGDPYRTPAGVVPPESGLQGGRTGAASSLTSLLHSYYPRTSSWVRKRTHVVVGTLYSFCQDTTFVRLPTGKLSLFVPRPDEKEDTEMDRTTKKRRGREEAMLKMRANTTTALYKKKIAGDHD